MPAIIFLTFLIICSSCSRTGEVNRDSMGIHINDINMEITRVDEIPWLVGKKRMETVTQSFVFMVETPKLSKSDLEYLTEQKGINSWLMRLIHNQGSKYQDLGSIYIPFRSKSRSRGHIGGQASNVAIKIYYAAAYASERFRMFKCPAFDHNFRINSLRILGELSDINLLFESCKYYMEKPKELELAPTAFNGGNSLKGSYYIEFAPYDSVRKKLHSPFIRIPQHIEISDEEAIVIPSCRGENPELIPRKKED